MFEDAVFAKKRAILDLREDDPLPCCACCLRALRPGRSVPLVAGSGIAPGGGPSSPCACRGLSPAVSDGVGDGPLLCSVGGRCGTTGVLVRCRRSVPGRGVRPCHYRALCRAFGLLVGAWRRTIAVPSPLVSGPIHGPTLTPHGPIGLPSVVCLSSVIVGGGTDRPGSAPRCSQPVTAVGCLRTCLWRRLRPLHVQARVRHRHRHRQPPVAIRRSNRPSRAAGGGPGVTSAGRGRGPGRYRPGRYGRGRCRSSGLGLLARRVGFRPVHRSVDRPTAGSSASRPSCAGQ